MKHLGEEETGVTKAISQDARTSDRDYSRDIPNKRHEC